MERKVNYTKEFKVQACELVVKNGLKVKAVADRMGISHIMLYRWIDQYKTFGKDAFVGKGHSLYYDTYAFLHILYSFLHCIINGLMLFCNYKYIILKSQVIFRMIRYVAKR